MTTLTYHDCEMQPVTVEGLTVADVAAQLAAGRHVHLNLEPGDCTRYTLYFIPHEEDPAQVLVVRDVGGHVTAAWIDSGFSVHDLGPLVRGNTWTAKVLAWYLGLLFDALAAEAAK